MADRNLHTAGPNILDRDIHLDLLGPAACDAYRKRSSSSNGLIGFADSDWANSLSWHSTTGKLFLYNSTPIAWRSKLQKEIALSMAEAEYYSASRNAVDINLSPAYPSYRSMPVKRIQRGLSQVGWTAMRPEEEIPLRPSVAIWAASGAQYLLGALLRHMLHTMPCV